METINIAKRGDIVKFKNGCIGIYKFSYMGAHGRYVMCSACCFTIGNKASNPPKVLFHTPVFSNDYTVVTNSDDKDLIAFINALRDEYTKEDPEWEKYLTDSTYFEIKDWLKSKIMVKGVDIDEEGDVINDSSNIDTTIGDIAYYICSHTSDDELQTVSHEEPSILDKLAETAYEYELDTKHISTSTDVLEMHDDTCHYLNAKLSNIRHGSEVIKSASSTFTQTQEALFEMVWACLAELNKRNVDIEELVEWKLNKIS